MTLKPHTGTNLENGMQQPPKDTFSGHHDGDRRRRKDGTGKRRRHQRRKYTSACTSCIVSPLPCLSLYLLSPFRTLCSSQWLWQWMSKSYNRVSRLLLCFTQTKSRTTDSIFLGLESKGLFKLEKKNTIEKTSAPFLQRKIILRKIFFIFFVFKIF